MHQHTLYSVCARKMVFNLSIMFIQRPEYYSKWNWIVTILSLSLMAWTCNGYSVHSSDIVHGSALLHIHHCSFGGEPWINITCEENHFIAINESIVGFSDTFWADDCPSTLGSCWGYTNDPARECNFQQNCYLPKNITQKNIGCLPTNYIDIYYNCVQLPGEVTDGPSTSDYTRDPPPSTQHPSSSSDTTTEVLSTRSTRTETETTTRIHTTAIELVTTSTREKLTTRVPSTSERSLTTTSTSLTSSGAPREVTTKLTSIATSEVPSTPSSRRSTESTIGSSHSSSTTKSTTTTQGHLTSRTTDLNQPTTAFVDDEGNIGALIGIIIGAVLLLVAVIIIAVCCSKKQKEDKAPPPSEDPVNMRFPHIIMPAVSNKYQDLESNTSSTTKKSEPNDSIRIVHTNKAYGREISMTTAMDNIYAFEPVSYPDTLKLQLGTDNEEDI